MKKSHIAWVIVAVILIILAIGFIISQIITISTTSTTQNIYEVEKSALMAADSVGGFAAPTQKMIPPNTTVEQERLIIKTGNLSIVVDDVRKAAKQITAFAVAKGGFVVSSNIYELQANPSADITIRIPVEIFDSGVEEIKNVGEVKSENMNGQDVTEEFVDLDAQIRNLQRTEQQFLEIMQRATRIEDVLAVQRELTNVRQQIELIQGRMKYLEKSAKLSTLTIYLSTDPEQLPVIDDEDSWKPLATIKNAARSLIAFGTWVVDVLIWIAVYIPLWLLIALVAHLMYRKIKKHKA